MSKPLLLDLFCGAGGAAAGYDQAGFKVVGVDIVAQPRYPFEFHQADALEFPLDGFDVIHASPPCQRFSRYRRGMGTNEGFPDFINDVRERLKESGAKHYVIENVPGSPLRANIMLCGSSFDLDVRRHRIFETTFRAKSPPCRHEIHTPQFPKAKVRENLRRTVEVGSGRVPMWQQNAAMEIYWMTRTEICQAIPPAYTRWLGERILEVMDHGGSEPS